MSVASSSSEPEVPTYVRNAHDVVLKTLRSTKGWEQTQLLEPELHPMRGRQWCVHALVVDQQTITYEQIEQLLAGCSPHILDACVHFTDSDGLNIELQVCDPGSEWTATGLGTPRKRVSSERLSVLLPTVSSEHRVAFDMLRSSSNKDRAKQVQQFVQQLDSTEQDSAFTYDVMMLLYELMQKAAPPALQFVLARSKAIRHVSVCRVSGFTYLPIERIRSLFDWNPTLLYDVYFETKPGSLCVAWWNANRSTTQWAPSYLQATSPASSYFPAKALRKRKLELDLDADTGARNISFERKATTPARPTINASTL